MSEHTPAIVPKQSFFTVAADAWKMAETLARSSMIPDTFRGKPENVFLALELAHRVDVSPLHVMQNLYVISGKPFLAASFLIGMINQSGLFAGRLKFEVQQDPLAVTCYTHEKTGERVSTTVTWKQAERAGWVDKKGSKYGEMPEIMLQYRAATFFARLHCPEVMFGFHTDVEADSFEPRDVKADPLDRALAPSKVEPATAEAEGARPADATQYVPLERVNKLAVAFAKVGLGADYIVARYGPLGEITPELYAEAVADGKERLRLQEEAERDAAAAQEAARQSQEDLFPEQNDGPHYD